VWKGAPGNPVIAAVWRDLRVDLTVPEGKFNRAMRIIDPYDEINYLGMECDMLGADWIRPLLNEALPASCIAPPPPALRVLYAAFRCLLCARLSIVHLLEKPIRRPAK
jgi:hypothetical protein